MAASNLTGLPMALTAAVACRDERFGPPGQVHAIDGYSRSILRSPCVGVHQLDDEHRGLLVEVGVRCRPPKGRIGSAAGKGWRHHLAYR
jgi:hypothetical protein